MAAARATGRSGEKKDATWRGRRPPAAGCLPEGLPSPFASGVPGVITGTRVSSSRFDVDERPCPGNVLVCVTHTRIKRDGGHAATMRSRQGGPDRPGPAPVR